MQIGVKTYLDKRGLAYARALSAHVDHIEMLVRPGDNIQALKRLKEARGIPITLHMPHCGHGVNISNHAKHVVNCTALETCIDAANILDAKVIVIHPGLVENRQCTVDSVITFLKDNFDRRLHIENMPALSMGKHHVGRDVREIKKILRACKVHFCLDIGHSFVTSLQKKADPYPKIRRFLELKPRYIHISDTLKTNIRDQHLFVGDGDVNYTRLARYLPKKALYTLEVPVDTARAREQVAHFRELLESA